MNYIIACKDSQTCKNLFNSIIKNDKGAKIQTINSFVELLSFSECTDCNTTMFLKVDFLGDCWFSNFQQINGIFADTNIVLIYEENETKNLELLFNLGCHNFIPNNSSPEVFSLIVRLILLDKQYIPPCVFITSLLNKKQKSTDKSYILPNGRKLTRRQKQMLGFLAEGLSNKQIAFNLDIAEATVKLHMNALFKMLQVTNRMQAFLLAQKMGIDKQS